MTQDDRQPPPTRAGARRSRLLPIGALVLGIGAALTAFVLGRPAEERRPNVLIVLWDTVRADRMSVYGHDRPTTPFLERFATEAVVYEHAIASSEWTGPTHASLFTGLPLQTHGMDTHYKWLDGHHLTLAEHLAAHGYDTWSFSGNRFVSDFVNLLQGFRVQDHTFKGRYKRAAARATRAKLLPRDASTEISPAYQGDSEGWSKQLTLFKDAAPVSLRAFANFLEQEHEQDKPFFAFVNLMEAHQPRIPSLESRRALMDEATLQRALTTDSSLHTLMAFMHGRHSYTEPELEAMRATYDATLLDLDKAAERLITGMEKRGLLEDTIVVFTADHGEMLGEKGLYSHRWALYEPLIHVPLLVRYPRKLQPARIDGAVSLNSLFATVCELTGLPVPDGIAPALAPGRPVFSELRDPNRAMPSILKAFADLDMSRFERSLSAVIDGPHKLIRSSDAHHELYHLGDDPEERHPLDRPDLQTRLLDLLSDFDAATPDYDPARRAPTDNRKQLDDPETLELLQVLGYSEETP